MKIKELVLSILLCVAIIMDYVIPQPLAFLAQNVISKIIMLGIVGLVFIKKRFILGILLFVFMIKLHFISSMQTYIPSEYKKMSIMKSLNVFDSISLEEEIIQQQEQL